jgi:hypothetical protein
MSALLVAIVPARSARAQDITVKATEGRTSDSHEDTTLEFSTTTQESVSVNRITDSFVATTGHSAAAFQTVCKTPCTLSVAPGFYRMRFGGGGMFDPGIDLSVNGGKRSFDVTPTSYGYLIGGNFLMAGGLLLGLMGFAVTEGSYADDTVHVSTTGRIMNVSGLIALVLGGYMAWGPGLGSVNERK